MNRLWLCILAAVIIAGIILAAYQPTLFNFFISDDYGMIARLESAKRNVGFFKEQFHQSWLQEKYYYRPLTSCFLAIEYALWGANGLCFRLSSIVGLALSSLIVGSISYEFGRQFNNEQYQHSKVLLCWAVLSSALFALYPLHGEPVNWCVCQHDILATFFCLLSFWSYLRWRKSSEKIFLVLSLFCMALGLLCKETVAILPLVLCVYNLLYVNISAHLSNETETTRISKIRQPLSKLRESFVITSLYWLVLIAYFCVRKMVLEVFLTNHAAVCFNNPMGILKTWLGSIRHIFIPMDSSIIPPTSPISLVWEVIIILTLVLSFKAFKNSDKGRSGVFLITWFILSLLPTFPVFMINSLLANARFAYLATAPLCMFLTYGIANLSFDYKYKTYGRTIGGILIIASAFILYRNNQSCSFWGVISNKMVNELKAYYQTIHDDPQVRLLNLPTVESSWVIGGMTKKPFLDRDILNCHAFYQDDKLLPFGFLRESIETKKNGMNCLCWDWQSKTLKPVCFYSMSAALPRSWSAEKLKDIVHIDAAKNPLSNNFIWEKSGILHVVSNRPSVLKINLEGFPCWSIDFIRFKIIMTPFSTRTRPIVLYVFNDIDPHYPDKDLPSWNAICPMEVTANGKEQNVIFPLRGMPYWAMGGKCHGIKLILPAHSDIRLLAIDLPETKAIIPIIKGPSIIQLDHTYNHQIIHFDDCSVSNCTQIAFEIISPDTNFERLYSATADKNALFDIRVNKCSGKLDLCRSSFHANAIGLYKARLRALDKNGEQVGLSGDHFLINVE